jgi:hypothetical protein
VSGVVRRGLYGRLIGRETVVDACLREEPWLWMGDRRSEEKDSKKVLAASRVGREWFALSEAEPPASPAIIVSGWHLNLISEYKYSIYLKSRREDRLAVFFTTPPFMTFPMVPITASSTSRLTEDLTFTTWLTLRCRQWSSSFQPRLSPMK